MRSGRLKSLDGSAFAEEFGIGCHVDGEIGSLFPADPLYFVARADGHGGLGDDDERAFRGQRDLGGRRVDVGQIRMAVAVARGRPDRDEDGLHIGDRAGQIGRKREPLFADVALHEFLQPGLVDRDATLAKGRDLGLVMVDAGDVVAEVREAGAGHQPDITRTRSLRFANHRSPKRPRTVVTGPPFNASRTGYKQNRPERCPRRRLFAILTVSE